jgi:hypothetical protein
LFSDSSRAEEEFGAFVKIFDAARTQVVAFFEQALILQATGATPDFLDQHAKDRGTTRQDSETDSDLRQRLRTIEDALTRPLLIQQAQTIIDAVPIAGTVAMVELPRDAAHIHDFVSDTGPADGGTFSDLGGGEFKFEPTTKFELPLTVDFEGSGSIGPPELVISGAATGANDGTFVVKRLDDDGVVFDNAGFAEVDPACTWTVVKRDIDGNTVDGFAAAHFDRGYRFTSTGIIIILPFGCTASTEASVFEMLRQKKGAGVLAVVECRAVP